MLLKPVSRRYRRRERARQVTGMTWMKHGKYRERKGMRVEV